MGNCSGDGKMGEESFYNVRRRNGMTSQEDEQSAGWYSYPWAGDSRMKMTTKVKKRFPTQSPSHNGNEHTWPEPVSTTLRFTFLLVLEKKESAHHHSLIPLFLVDVILCIPFMKREPEKKMAPESLR